MQYVYLLIFYFRDVGNYDRIVVQDVIKEMAQFSQIDSEKQKPFKGSSLSKFLFSYFENSLFFLNQVVLEK